VLVGVVHDKPEFLLRRVRLGPDFTFLRQEDAAKQRGQFFVSRRHLLQRRLAVGKSE